MKIHELRKRFRAPVFDASSEEALARPKRPTVFVPPGDGDASEFIPGVAYERLEIPHVPEGIDHGLEVLKLADEVGWPSDTRLESDSTSETGPVLSCSDTIGIAEQHYGQVILQTDRFRAVDNIYVPYFYDITRPHVLRDVYPRFPFCWNKDGKDSYAAAVKHQFPNRLSPDELLKLAHRAVWPIGTTASPPVVEWNSDSAASIYRAEVEQRTIGDYTVWILPNFGVCKASAVPKPTREPPKPPLSIPREEAGSLARRVGKKSPRRS